MNSQAVIPPLQSPLNFVAFEADPDFQSGEPTKDMLSFLDRIKTADPNSSDLSEDDSNASWGHYQFTVGSQMISTVLTSWKSVTSYILANIHNFLVLVEVENAQIREVSWRQRNSFPRREFCRDESWNFCSTLRPFIWIIQRHLEKHGSEGESEIVI